MYKGRRAINLYERTHFERHMVCGHWFWSAITPHLRFLGDTWQEAEKSRQEWAKRVSGLGPG
jgi:hypothetical protein